MSIQLKFNGLVINKINYRYNRKEIKEVKDQFLDFELNNIEVSISDDEVVINLSGLINCKNDDKKETVGFRILKLDVDYFYIIDKSKKNEVKDINSVIKNYAVNNSILMFENLIKHITSLDYTEPIIVNDFKFPGELIPDKN